MKIQFYMVSKEINGAKNQSNGECDSVEEAKRQFGEFLDNHGTNFNDYDEFHCRFVDDARGEGGAE